ncbi:MAG: hypothetical protein RL367_2608 [Pseudomonadota bacterium]
MSAQTEQANICVGCGICCTGALFGRVPLDADEVEARSALGLGLSALDGKTTFDLPCSRFADGGCSVYPERPNVCRSYRCQLKKDHDRGTVPVERARAIIAQALALDWSGFIRPALTELADVRRGSLDKLIVAAHDTIAASDNPAALRSRYGMALVRAAALAGHLRAHFRPDRSPDRNNAGKGD